MLLRQNKVVEMDCGPYKRMMNRLTLICAASALLLSLLLTSCGSILSAASLEPDPRLTQKVTIDCTGVRLHTALERISAETGVTVHSGKSSTDWKVRDVPVLVCARDIPLGTLLKAIADTNHLFLSRNRIDDLITYRIWRDLKREKELSAFEAARQAAVVAAASYDWDALSMVQDLPDSAFPTDSTYADYYAKLRAESSLISALGPEVKDRVLSGEAVTIGVINAPEHIKPYLMNVLRTYQESSERSANKHGAELPKPLEEYLNDCCVRIGFGDQRFSLSSDLLEMQIPFDRGIARNDYDGCNKLIKKHMPDFPSRPEIPKSMPGEEDLDKQYAKLLFEGDGAPDFLKTTLKVEVPKSDKAPSYSLLLKGACDATGYSIVAEGAAARYRGEVLSSREDLTKMFNTQITVRQVLEFIAEAGKVQWYIDEPNKLIIVRDLEWVQNLQKLVPEKLLIEMNDKVKKGVELDDLDPLLGLTADQVREWFYYCPEYPNIKQLYKVAFDLGQDRISQLYFKLTPQQRSLAKSGKSVSLAGIDKNTICRMLRQEASTEAFGIFLNGAISNKNHPVDRTRLDEFIARTRLDAYTDPNMLPDLWFRIEKHAMNDGSHYYLTYIESKDNSKFKKIDQISGEYPIRPPKQQ